MFHSFCSCSEKSASVFKMSENWTIEERQAVEKFKQVIQNDVPEDVRDDDFLYYRFLKARNFNLQQAELMLRKHLKWRKEIQFEHLSTDFQSYEVLEKYAALNYIGFDKNDCIVIYVAAGSIDGRGIFKSANSFDVFRHTLKELEKFWRQMVQHSKMIGRPVNQFVFIGDVEHLTLAKATHRASIQLLMIGISIVQDNFPEIMKNIYIINAASYFMMGFSIVKAVLSGEVINKIKIYGKNGWKEDLLGILDADILPAFLGGDRTDPDGNVNCNTWINHGGDIPERYYLTKDIQRILSSEGTKSITIAKRSRVRIPVVVEDCNAILNWEYETKCHDIGIGLSLAGNHQNPAESELIPVYRVETEFIPNTVVYRCHVPGTYIIIFDNSYSWFHTKEVHYRTWITFPPSVSIGC